MEDGKSEWFSGSTSLTVACIEHGRSELEQTKRCWNTDNTPAFYLFVCDVSQQAHRLSNASVPVSATQPHTDTESDCSYSTSITFTKGRTIVRKLGNVEKKVQLVIHGGVLCVANCMCNTTIDTKTLKLICNSMMYLIHFHLVELQPSLLSCLFYLNFIFR